ncbi:restriction endonuclease [Paenibacillus sp. TRM 82003]|nr:restriction endonuclease [Paenibacillus sp. TRM 82003]
MIPSIVLFGTFIALGLLAVVLHQRKTTELNNELSSLYRLISRNEDIKKILLAGMYQRFKKEEGKTEDTPIDFEHFVADTFRQYYGGEVRVTRATGDGGVDLIHEYEGKLRIGQVKCYAPAQAVDYIPVAVLHSQMQRYGADGGFVVSTSDYTRTATEYAESVGIDLLDGRQFLELWMETVRMAEEGETPDDVRLEAGFS